MVEAATAFVSADHPSLAGHFPGRPLVPGVMLLELAVEAARTHLGCGRLTRVVAAKFLRPVLPGEHVAYAVVTVTAQRCRFSANVGGALAAEGELEFAP
jgi:3-hydroxyacyl-[acyl-carrier-protein] dehydratase